ncbi:MAG: UDP-3-O-acyl-N-acetylglucosamine deacetylase [Bacteroidales bacterium]|nr:UDP-3-O-acyl-N-acetylglucosamine deacetylase [Bacteroidales bacterium]
MKQKTIKQEFHLEGKGLHSGKQVSVSCMPAPAGHGIKFYRTDLADTPCIEATPDNVGSTNRGTAIRIADTGIEVKTIEHLMSALAGTGIYNAKIYADGEEVPILTGNAEPFVKAIMQAGTEELEADQPVFRPEENIYVKDPSSDSAFLIEPAEHFSLHVNVDFHSKVLGAQQADFSDMTTYAEQIAPCRTFCFLHEILPLIKLGLIKGGDVENAIVYVENDISEQDKKEVCAFFGKEEIKINTHGILNTRLYFENEVARHKLLDIMGDFALIGMPVQAKITADYPGHNINTRVASHIYRQYLQSRCTR